MEGQRNTERERGIETGNYSAKSQLLMVRFCVCSWKVVFPSMSLQVKLYLHAHTIFFARKYYSLTHSLSLSLSIVLVLYIYPATVVLRDTINLNCVPLHVATHAV